MGNVNGILALGNGYLTGIGVEEDEYKAFIYNQQSADTSGILALVNYFLPELELKKMNIRHHCKNRQRWRNVSGIFALGNSYLTELELKSMNIMLSFIINNRQRLDTLVECLYLVAIILPELELKRMNIRHHCKNQQRWKTLV